MRGKRSFELVPMGVYTLSESGGSSAIPLSPTEVRNVLTVDLLDQYLALGVCDRSATPNGERESAVFYFVV